MLANHQGSGDRGQKKRGPDLTAQPTLSRLLVRVPLAHAQDSAEGTLEISDVIPNRGQKSGCVRRYSSDHSGHDAIDVGLGMERPLVRDGERMQRQ